LQALALLESKAEIRPAHDRPCHDQAKDGKEQITKRAADLFRGSVLLFDFRHQRSFVWVLRQVCDRRPPKRQSSLTKARPCCVAECLCCNAKNACVPCKNDAGR